MLGYGGGDANFAEYKAAYDFEPLTARTRMRSSFLTPKITDNEPLDILRIYIYTNKVDIHI